MPVVIVKKELRITQFAKLLKRFCFIHKYIVWQYLVKWQGLVNVMINIYLGPIASTLL